MTARISFKITKAQQKERFSMKFYIADAFTETIFGGNPAGVVPVSYTHLDVYKRQIFETAGAVLHARRAIERGAF